MITGIQAETERLKKELQDQQDGVKDENQSADEEEITTMNVAMDEIADDEDQHQNDDNADDDDGQDEAEEAQSAADDEDKDDADDDGDLSDTKKLRKRIESNYRKKLKEKEQEMKALREQSKQTQELMQQLLSRQQQQPVQSQQPAQEEADPEPDKLLDPEDHIRWENRQLAKKINTLEKMQSEHQRYLQVQKVRDSVKTLENEYLRENPHVKYKEAEEFIKNREGEILRLQNPDLTDAEIDNYFEQHKITLFRNAAQKKQNAADLIVKMAEKYGFSPNEAKNSKKQVNMDKIKRNQKKNANIIGGSDAIAQHDASSEQLLNMSFKNVLARQNDLKKKIKDTQLG